jgi:type I restriction enzyme R subunit
LQPSTQSDLIRSIDSKLGLDPQLRQMFHLLRMRGNEAVHEVGAAIGYREALESLKVAREVASLVSPHFWQQCRLQGRPVFAAG